ncbi:MAG: PEGA domain-containing protein [Bradyrhizobiaceae bacterium]|nr:MAG: PEGA domain-containing protein [Bradyrhizobiaceae bacterium]
MRIIIVAALCAALGGCASVARGTSETISVATTPAGAAATVSGLDQPLVCTTPCAFTAARSADITVSIAKEGYEPQVIPLTKEVTGSGGATFAGNLLLGGIIGMGVDAATGAAQDHKPNPVIVTLQPISPPPSPPKPRRPKAPPRPTS